MSEEPDTESFEIAGTRFTRRGRFIEAETHRTPEQQQEMDAVLAKLRDEAEERIATATRELEVELGKCHSFDILSNLMVAELSIDPETYKEWSHKGSQAHVEYATLLALKGEFRSDGDPPEIEKIQRLLVEIFSSASWYYTGEQADHKSSPDAAAELRFRTIIYGITDGNPGYEHHLHNILKRLFGHPSVSAWLKGNLGFTVEEALKLNQAAVACINERCQVAKEDASFTVEELADATGVDTVVARAYLRARSLEFGSVDTKFAMPTSTSPLAQCPFVHHERRYLVTTPGWLNWGLKDYLEGQLKSGNLWQRYSKLRGDFLEDEALKLLGAALPHAKVHRNLKYLVVEDGVTKEVELDGLILLDRALFLVEAKAGSLTAPAQRGAPERIRADLKKLLGEAHSQGLRGRTYITETEEPKFKSGTGEVVHIDPSQVDHIFVVAVTLDPLAVFTPALHEVAKLGIFTPGELPWAVSIYDLQVICEMLEFPCQLVHYLQRRSRLNELGRMETTDELDWFGHYLTEGLYFEEYPPDFQILLGTYTTEFDDYYLYEQGQRSTPAAIPRQPMPPFMRQLLAELEEQHPPGYLTGALILLDMSFQSRENFAQAAEMQRRKSQNDGRHHDATVACTEGRSGVTVMTTKRLPADKLLARLVPYCHFKKYELQADRWAGFGILADQPGSFHVYCSQSTPWRFDEATAAALPEFKKHIKA